MKLNLRPMFPISFYRYSNNKEFNAFLFLVDCLLYIIPISILIANILNS